MPAFSGLYDGVFGEPYAAVPKANPKPPISGIVRVLLQKRGLYGMVRAFGGNAPVTVKAVDAQRNDIAMRGGWDYATRSDDPANRVTVTNIGGDVNVLEDRAMPATVADADALQRTTDTHLNREYTDDKADLGITAPALPERYAV